MGTIKRNLRSFSGGLVGLAVMLIALFFIMNWIASRGWGPLSGVASFVETHANGSAYSGSPAMAGVPSSPSYGPAL